MEERLKQLETEVAWLTHEISKLVTVIATLQPEFHEHHTAVYLSDNFINEHPEIFKQGK